MATTKKKTTRKTSSTSRIEKAIDAIAVRLEKAENFTLEHAPDICKEIVEVEKVKVQNQLIPNGLVLLILSIVGIFCYHVAFGLPPGAEDCGYHKGEFLYSEGYRLLTGIVGALLLALGTCLLHDTISSVLRLREIKAGPKTLILRKLTRMLK